LREEEQAALEREQSAEPIRRQINDNQKRIEKLRSQLEELSASMAEFATDVTKMLALRERLDQIVSDNLDILSQKGVESVSDLVQSEEYREEQKVAAFTETQERLTRAAKQIADIKRLLKESLGWRKNLKTEGLRAGRARRDRVEYLINGYREQVSELVQAEIERLQDETEELSLNTPEGWKNKADEIRKNIQGRLAERFRLSFNRETGEPDERSVKSEMPRSIKAELVAEQKSLGAHFNEEFFHRVLAEEINKRLAVEIEGHRQRESFDQIHSDLKIIRKREGQSQEALAALDEAEKKKRQAISALTSKVLGDQKAVEYLAYYSRAGSISGEDASDITAVEQICERYLNFNTFLVTGAESYRGDPIEEYKRLIKRSRDIYDRDEGITQQLKRNYEGDLRRRIHQNDLVVMDALDYQYIIDYAERLGNQYQELSKTFSDEEIDVTQLDVNKAFRNADMKAKANPKLKLAKVTVQFLAQNYYSLGEAQGSLRRLEESFQNFLEEQNEAIPDEVELSWAKAESRYLEQLHPEINELMKKDGLKMTATKALEEARLILEELKKLRDAANLSVRTYKKDRMFSSREDNEKMGIVAHDGRINEIQKNLETLKSEIDIVDRQILAKGHELEDAWFWQKGKIERQLDQLRTALQEKNDLITALEQEREKRLESLKEVNAWLTQLRDRADGLIELESRSRASVEEVANEIETKLRELAEQEFTEEEEELIREYKRLLKKIEVLRS